MILLVWGSNEPNIREGNLEVEDLGADMCSCFLSDDEIKNPTPQTPTPAKLAAVAVQWRIEITAEQRSNSASTTANSPVLPKCSEAGGGEKLIKERIGLVWTREAAIRMKRGGDGDQRGCHAQDEGTWPSSHTQLAGKFYSCSYRRHIV